jgi:hypothetical protein
VLAVIFLATLVRKFVEDDRERLDGRFISPEFETQKKLTELAGSCGSNTRPAAR